MSTTTTNPTFHFHALPNGITLHAAHWGDPAKPLMLFLHGFPEFWYAWRNVAPALAGDYFCVAPDMRGFNLSSMPSELSDYKAHKIAQDIGLLIAALKKPEAIVVSHDWGGAVGWSYAIAQTQGLAPKLMKAHISINSPHPYTFGREMVNNPAQQAASAYMLWLREPFAADALRKDNFAKLKSFLFSISQDKRWFTDDIAAQYEACWARGLEGGLNYYRATPLVPKDEKQSTASSWQPDLKALQVDMPTLVIWGEADVALLPSLLDGLDSVVKNLKIVREKDRSHWICHEAPKVVAAHIHTFVTTVI
jgi:epoxide hydrolase 4